MFPVDESVWPLGNITIRGNYYSWPLGACFLPLYTPLVALVQCTVKTFLYTPGEHSARNER